MKFFVFSVVIFLSMICIIGCDSSSQYYHIDEAYKGLRERVFNLDPASVNIIRSESESPKGVWGVVMETGYPKGVFTLLALRDGTISYYFSTGGGSIGLGQYDEPRRIARDYLEMANAFVAYCEPTEKYPLPKREHTRFYLLTYAGILTAEAPEAQFGAGTHPLAPLYGQADDLITAVRIIDEKHQAEKENSP